MTTETTQTARKSSSAWKWIGTVSGTVIAAVLVFFLVGPTGLFVKPPPPPPPAPPAPMSASIQDITLATARPCCEFSIGFTINGFRGRTTTGYAQVVDANTGERGQWAQAFTARPEADQDSARILFPVSIGYQGDYFVIVVINDPNGTEIARQQTTTISVR